MMSMETTLERVLMLVSVLLLMHRTVICQNAERTPPEDAENTKDQKVDCGFTVSPVWKASLRGSPITTTPILYDIDMDGYSDIIVATVTGEVWAVHGESGHVIDNWPFYLEGKSFHSSPLLYDITRDGTNEIAVVTSDAEIVFVHREGFLAYGETIKLPPLETDRRWYMLSVEEQEKLVHELANQMKTSTWEIPKITKTTRGPVEGDSNDVDHMHYSQKTDPLYSRHEPRERKSGLSDANPDKVYVDPHVMATPIITDTNGDGLRDEMVVPVSYYFDPYHYGNAANLRKLHLNKEELKNFVASALVNVNLTDGSILWQKFLGITQGTSEQPAYVLSSPTPVKLSEYSGSDVLVGTAKGELHFLTGWEGKEKKGFPIQMDSVATQVAVGDVDVEGIPHIIACDNSGNVQCLNLNGQPRWERKLESPVVGVRFGDVSGNSEMDLVLTAQDGTIHILSAASGAAVKDSKNVGVEISVPPLLAGVQQGKKPATKLVVVPSSPFQGTSSNVFFFDAKRDCMYKQEVGAGSYSSVLLGNLLPHDTGYEFLVTLEDGTLLCYRFIKGGISLFGNSSNIWESEVPLGNQFTHKSQSVHIVPYSPSLLSLLVTKKEFDLKFDIVFGGLSPPPSVYVMEVSMGNRQIMYKENIEVGKGTDVFSVSIPIPSPTSPFVGQIELRVCTVNDVCDHVYYNMRFNVHFEEHLKWCLAVPFICLCLSILWFVRGETGPVVLPTAGQLGQSGPRKNI